MQSLSNRLLFRAKRIPNMQASVLRGAICTNSTIHSQTKRPTNRTKPLEDDEDFAPEKNEKQSVIITWNSSSVASAWNAASSSVSACMSVSGTYLPPNLPNLPMSSGLASPAAPLAPPTCGAASAATAFAGGIAATATDAALGGPDPGARSGTARDGSGAAAALAAVGVGLGTEEAAIGNGWRWGRFSGRAERVYISVAFEFLALGWWDPSTSWPGPGARIPRTNRSHAFCGYGKPGPQIGPVSCVCGWAGVGWSVGNTYTCEASRSFLLQRQIGEKKISKSVHVDRFGRRRQRKGSYIQLLVAG
jgi:hypothetical protein